MKCYCCSGKEFENCCQPFISEAAKPATAEELMRSRYSAHATVDVEYIIRTTHSSTRKFHAAELIEKWERSSVWQKLEIISKVGGEARDIRGVVEFRAYFLNANNEPQVNYEVSEFRKELGI